MANTFKNAFAESCNISTASPNGYTTVLVCPSANQSKCVLIGLHLTNTTSSEVTATVQLVDSSDNSNVINLVTDVPLPANSMLAVLTGDKIILEESDELRVVAGTATAVNAFASYLLSDNT